jgi:carotenoid cleavage dioxygenase
MTRGEPIGRRELLRRGAVGAMALSGAAAFLAACGDGSGGAGARAAAPARRAAPVDDRPWWLQGNFAPVAREVETTHLEVDGEIPAGLDGLYVRNGSNPLGGRSPHWFLGDGMVHGVMLGAGRAAWYRNRYVHTALLAAGGGLAAAGAPGGAAGLSNVSMAYHGGRLLALGEIGFPYEISPADLTTVGPFDYAGELAGNMTAHPKIDPATGRLHGFGYEFTPPYLRYTVVDPDGTLVSTEPVEVRASTMIHDFAVTERDVVFWEGPVLFDMDLALKMVSDPGADVMPFVWKPEYGSRIGVMPLGGPAAAIRWVELDEPCFVFHGINAHRAGDDVVIDVCRLDRVFADSTLGAPPRWHRWTVSTGGPSLSVRDEAQSDVIGDLPTIDRRRTGRPYRYAYRAELRATPATADFAGVTRRDLRTGREVRWDPGRARSAGEWLFVPSGEGEDEGFLLSYVYDRADDSSALVVLDAADVAAGPVGSVRLPQRVPYGFHATWVPTRPV